jgi:hypothetical protein
MCACLLRWCTVHTHLVVGGGGGSPHHPRLTPRCGLRGEERLDARLHVARVSRPDHLVHARGVDGVGVALAPGRGACPKRLLIEARWGQNRWHLLVNCNHGDSSSSRVRLTPLRALGLGELDQAHRPAERRPYLRGMQQLKALGDHLGMSVGRGVLCQLGGAGFVTARTHAHT